MYSTGTMAAVCINKSVVCLDAASPCGRASITCTNAAPAGCTWLSFSETVRRLIRCELLSPATGVRLSLPDDTHRERDITGVSGWRSFIIANSSTRRIYDSCSSRNSSYHFEVHRSNASQRNGRPARVFQRARRASWRHHFLLPPISPPAHRLPFPDCETIPVSRHNRVPAFC